MWHASALSFFSLSMESTDTDIEKILQLLNIEYSSKIVLFLYEGNFKMLACSRYSQTLSVQGSIWPIENGPNQNNRLPDSFCILYNCLINIVGIISE